MAEVGRGGMGVVYEAVQRSLNHGGAEGAAIRGGHGPDPAPAVPDRGPGRPSSTTPTSSRFIPSAAARRPLLRHAVYRRPDPGTGDRRTQPEDRCLKLDRLPAPPTRLWERASARDGRTTVRCPCQGWEGASDRAETPDPVRRVSPDPAEPFGRGSPTPPKPLTEGLRSQRRPARQID